MFATIKGIAARAAQPWRSGPVRENGLPAFLGVSGSSSGIAVGPESAMRSTPVRCAVQTIAEAIGQLPVHVYERQADGSRQRSTTHPAARLLRDEVTDWMPASDFREQLTRDALLHGNGYAFINRVDGEVRELIRLAPTAVSVEANPVTHEPIYRVSEAHAQRIVDRRDMLHIRAPSRDGLTGVSPIFEARDAIGLALAMERHAAQLFGNGARPSGVLSFDQKLDDGAITRIRHSWSMFHAREAAGGTAILENGGKFLPLTFSSVDSQFLELWQHAITEIARAFRVPPHLLYELGRATWGNAEEMGAQFVTFSLMRWVKVWQGELRLKLFGEEERDRFFAEFLLDDLLRADIGKRAEAYAKLIASRVLNPNEVRAMENRAPYDGGDAFINPNTTTDAASREPAGEDE